MPVGKWGKLESFANDVFCLQCGEDAPIVQRAGSMLSTAVTVRPYVGRQLVSDRDEDKRQLLLVSTWFLIA